MTKKKGTFSKVKAVKSNSRDRIGPVPPTRVVPHKNRETVRITKHPKEAIEELRDDCQTPADG